MKPCQTSLHATLPAPWYILTQSSFLAEPPFWFVRLWSDMNWRTDQPCRPQGRWGLVRRFWPCLLWCHLLAPLPLPAASPWWMQRSNQSKGHLQRAPPPFTRKLILTLRAILASRTDPPSPAQWLLQIEQKRGESLVWGCLNWAYPAPRAQEEVTILGEEQKWQDCCTAINIWGPTVSCWLTASQSNKTGLITASEPILKATDDVQAAGGED